MIYTAPIKEGFVNFCGYRIIPNISGIEEGILL